MKLAPNNDTRAVWYAGAPWYYRPARIRTHSSATGREIELLDPEPNRWEGAELGSQPQPINDPLLLDAIREDQDRLQNKGRCDPGNAVAETATAAAP